MKILVIRGKNLASLAGEFEVDFTREPLSAAGIFAITGSTGSGKSTLLDALCLALFDSTPRLMKAKEAKVELTDVSQKTVAQSDSRSVLRRGTAEGYAEVEFVALTKQVYRATWSVARTGGRATGSLRSVTMRLANLSEDREEQGTKKELLGKISRLIGLSFEQFNRSVLLAQGDFALFLKAKQAEKAEILEKLTGTDIYSRVSTSIYGKTKAAEMDYKLLQARMKDIELFPNEKMEELAKEKHRLAEELVAMQKEQETVNASLKWLDEERALSQNKEKAAKELTVVAQEKEQAAPRYAALVRLERAQEVRDVFMQTTMAFQQLDANRKTLEEKQRMMQKTSTLVQEASEQRAAAQKQLSEWKEYIASKEPELNEAKELDMQLVEGVKQWEAIGKELNGDIGKQEGLERKIAECEQTVKKLDKKQLDIAAWFKRYQGYANLIPVIELVVSMLASWETAKEQTNLNRKTLDEIRSLAEVEQSRLKEMQEEAERLNHLQPAEVVLLRAQLRDGEPCPVCGSTHHPAATLTEVQSLQEAELNRAKEKVAKEIERLTASVTARSLEIARLTTVVENYMRQATETLSKVTSYVSILPSWQDLLNKGTLKDAVKRFGVQWADRLQAQGETKEALAKHQTQLEALKHERDDIVRLIQEKLDKRGVVEKEIHAGRARRAKMLNGWTVNDFTRHLTTQQKAFEQSLEEAMKKHHDLLGTLESVKGQVMQLEKEKERLQVLSEEGKQALEAWLSHQADIASSAELKELLAKDAAWVAKEKRELEALKERFNSIQVVLAERTRKLEEHSLLPQKPSSLSSLSPSSLSWLEQKEEAGAFLQGRRTELKVATEQQTTRAAQIGMILEAQEKNRRALEALEKELKEKSGVYENWAKLNDLFGSQSGVKFKEIAQAYTLDVLLLYANKHLKDLAPRYELQRISDTLALQIVDLDMMGEVRSVHSLSGGESFLVSLALALGLSSLSSNRMNVESLFIDEGFGSLDMDTLRIAMDALERLQMQGRKIGVISHVAEMTERITAQIQVVKTGNGKSVVKVVGQ